MSQRPVRHLGTCSVERVRARVTVHTDGSQPVAYAGVADPDRAGALATWLKLSERREPLVAQIATWVGLGIIEGRLPPGEDLNSVELSKRFQTSRTPVREALALLEQEGLVEMPPRRRPRVAAFSLETVQEIYEVREHLLAIVGRLVSRHIRAPAIEELRSRVEAMRTFADRGDVESYFWSHVMLQERMTDIAGNRTLKDILNSLAMRTLILRYSSIAQPGRLPASVTEQELIFDAIAHHDEELAAMLLARATRTAFAAIRDSWQADLPFESSATQIRRTPAS